MATKDTSIYDAKGNLITDNLYDPNTGTGNGHIQYDPTEYDSANKKRAEIVDYIRFRLADGIVDVELEKEHYEMSITQALIKYRQRSSNAVEESYAFINPAWPDRKILFFSPDKDSGTLEYFTEAVNHKSRSQRDGCQMSPDDNVLIRGVAGEKDSIGLS